MSVYRAALPAKPSGKLAQVEQVFVRQPPACQGQQAIAGLRGSVCHQLQGFVPGDRRQLAVLAHQRLGRGARVLSVNW